MRTVRHLVADCSGAMLVETAIVAPALLLLGVGGFQVSTIVARQHALQSAAAEAEQIALAAKPDSQTKLNTIKSVIVASTGLPAANITVSFIYRCGTNTAMVTDSSTCGSLPAWNFVHIVLTNSYTPMWADIGVGHTVSLRVDRTVQIS